MGGWVGGGGAPHPALHPLQAGKHTLSSSDLMQILFPAAMMLDRRSIIQELGRSGWWRSQKQQHVLLRLRVTNLKLLPGETDRW